MNDYYQFEAEMLEHSEPTRSKQKMTSLEQTRRDRDEAERAYRRHHSSRFLTKSDTDNAWCAGYTAHIADSRCTDDTPKSAALAAIAEAERLTAESARTGDAEDWHSLERQRTELLACLKALVCADDQTAAR